MFPSPLGSQGVYVPVACGRDVPSEPSVLAHSAAAHTAEALYEGDCIYWWWLVLSALHLYLLLMSIDLLKPQSQGPCIPSQPDPIPLQPTDPLGCLSLNLMKKH